MVRSRRGLPNTLSAGTGRSAAGNQVQCCGKLDNAKCVLIHLARFLKRKKPDPANVIAGNGLLKLQSAFSPLLAQLLFRNCVDCRYFRPSLELRKNFSHHRADGCCSTGDCGSDGGAKLVITYLRRKIFLEGGNLASLLFRELRPASLFVHVNRFATALDALSQDFDYFRVVWIPFQLDATILDVRENRTEEKCCRFVLCLSRRVEIIL